VLPLRIQAIHGNEGTAVLRLLYRKGASRPEITVTEGVSWP